MTLTTLTTLFTIKSFLSSLLLAACRNRPKEGVLITKKEVLQKLLLLKDLSQIKMAATYSPTLKAVPSACTGLTSLFGMGRGGTPAL